EAVALDDQRIDALAAEDMLEGHLDSGGSCAGRTGHRHDGVLLGHELLLNKLITDIATLRQQTAPREILGSPGWLSSHFPRWGCRKSALLNHQPAAGNKFDSPWRGVS